MSSEGESRAFEVERRVRGHRKIPNGFRKVKEYGKIIDAYVRVDDEAGLSERIRYGELVFKEGSPDISIENPLKLGKYVWKNIITREVVESETKVGDPMLFLEKRGEPEAVVVMGSRIAYTDGDNRMVITHDIVHRLGKFTEFEIMTDLIDVEMEEASKEVDCFVTSLGISKSEYAALYPLQILQLDILYEIYRSPITGKRWSARKMATQYKASVRTVRRLCKELEKLGYVLETPEGFWDPVGENVPDTGIDPHIEAIVCGKKPLFPDPEPEIVK